jgi:biofilm PGA synthesis N-glycosyltransferase PgaC
MKLSFWLSLSLVFFAYAGYPIWLYFRARLWPRPILRATIFPSVTIVLAVHNEARTLLAKFHNLAALDYPQDRLEVIIVSDGSTDETNDFLKSWENPKQRAIILSSHSGKATALNHGVAEARGEIIVFTDARQTIASDGLKNLVADFADSSVGCVSGALMIGEDLAATSNNGMGLYWRLEKNIRKWEALAGSTVGATGAFYAVRKDLLVPLPQGTILDDVYIPIHVARQGQRVIFEPRVLVWDHLTPGLKQEFRRKVRTLTGNYQLLQIAPWVLLRSNPLRFQFICHKLLRLLVPFALVGIFVSALGLRAGVYECVLVLQLVFYALAGLRVSRSKSDFVSRLSNISFTFIVLNSAAVVALIYFISGRKAVWAR